MAWRARLVREQSGHNLRIGVPLLPDSLDVRPNAEHGKAIVGRDMTADVQLGPAQAALHCSRQHAAISRDANGLFHIKDLFSANGTFVNGRRVMECILRNGDRLIFGGGINVPMHSLLDAIQEKNIAHLVYVFHTVELGVEEEPALQEGKRGREEEISVISQSPSETVAHSVADDDDLPTLSHKRKLKIRRTSPVLQETQGRLSIGSVEKLGNSLGMTLDLDSPSSRSLSVERAPSADTHAYSPSMRVDHVPLSTEFGAQSETQYGDGQYVSQVPVLPVMEPRPFEGIAPQSVARCRIGKTFCEVKGNVEFDANHWKMFVSNPNPTPVGSPAPGNLRLLIPVQDIVWYKDHRARRPFFLVFSTRRALAGISPTVYNPETPGDEDGPNRQGLLLRTVVLELTSASACKNLSRALLDNYMQYLTPENSGIVPERDAPLYFYGKPP